MLDVSWVGIVRIESLKLRVEYELRSESGGIHIDASIRGRTCLNRKGGRAAASGATWFGTIQIATDARYRTSRCVAPRFLAAVRQLQHRAPTFLLMRTNTYDRSQQDHC
jgi:hypothetical protein